MIEHLYEDLSVHLYEGEPITKKAPTPPPITYLTQWKIVGNSEVHGNEIWSCGEYNPIDGKWHILVQPLGGSIADIALDEPLRKVNDVADTIEFADGVTTVTRNLININLGNLSYTACLIPSINKYRYFSNIIDNVKSPSDSSIAANILCAIYKTLSGIVVASGNKGISKNSGIDRRLSVFDDDYCSENQGTALKEHLKDVYVICEVITPIVETVQVPQIEKAESYSMVISQGAKAISWSSFTTNNE